jgi:hypothetical protein
MEDTSQWMNTSYFVTATANCKQTEKETCFSAFDTRVHDNWTFKTTVLRNLKLCRKAFITKTLFVPEALWLLHQVGLRTFCKNAWRPVVVSDRSVW